MFCITYTHGTKEMQNRGESGRAVGWGKEENWDRAGGNHLG